jgi:hypothetical protein
MVERPLVGASVAFAASCAYGAIVSLRHDVVGEPFRVRLPGTVAQHLAVGLGSGLSAPWPMPVLLLVAAARSGSPVAWPSSAAVGVGMAGVAGTLVEPVTWQRRQRSPDVWLSVALNLLASTALLVTGTRRRHRLVGPSWPGQPRPRP